MSISKNQLETWASYQDLKVLTNTYSNIQTSLYNFNLPGNHKANQYLQGSYGNSTQIYGKGDIDVVVELNSVFNSNLNSNTLLNLGFADYGVSVFFNNLLIYLSNYYGVNNVENGTKTIKIKGTDGKKAVDVVVCNEYRKYEDPNNFNSKYVSGIILKNGIINYPKLHKANGENKMSNTNNMFKKYIRIFKNINKKLKNDNPYFYTSVPSYFIECLLYNIPNHLFDKDLSIGFESTLNWLVNKSIEVNGLDNLICQNEILKLIGFENTQWKLNECKTFISQVNTLNTN